MLVIRIFTKQGTIEEFSYDSVSGMSACAVLKECEDQVLAKGLDVREIIIIKPMFDGKKAIEN